MFMMQKMILFFMSTVVMGNDAICDVYDYDISFDYPSINISEIINFGQTTLTYGKCIKI